MTGGIDFDAIMGDVAIRLWGKPDSQTRTELRWGNRGARVVYTDRGRWCDYQVDNTARGVLDLLEREKGFATGAALVWLRDEGLVKDEPKLRRKIVAVYDYVNENGDLLSQVVRFEPKDFLQRRPDPDRSGSWIWKVQGIKSVPFRLPELLDAVALKKPIFVVEGEKDVLTLAKHGLTATCNAGGAGKWDPAFGDFFTQVDVIVVADNDEPGKEHAEDVVQSVIGKSARVRVLDLPGLAHKEDVTDWFEKHGGTIEQFNVLVEQATEWTLEGEDEPQAEPSPNNRFVFIDLARYDVDPVPEKQWSVEGKFGRGDVGLLSGEGGVGKSQLLEHLAVAQSLGRDWMHSRPQAGPVIIFNCEDDEEDIVRRLHPMLRSYGATFTEALRGGLHIRPLAGKDAILAHLDRSTGRITPTDLFHELEEMMLDIRPVTTIIDNAADVFDGDENNRSQVRQFFTLLKAPAAAAKSAIVVSSHPSLTGISSKTGLSGSTGWHNSGRFRAWLRAVKGKEGVELDTDLRELEFRKNQYGRLAENIVLRWKDGLFVPEPRPGSIENMAAEKRAADVFLDLLRRFIGSSVHVSHKINANNYAPKMFAREEEAKQAKVGKDILANAMARLFAEGHIQVERYGPPSKHLERIVPK